MHDLAKRNETTAAVITGGAQGIGLAIARQLIAEGSRSIAISGRDVAKGRAAADGLGALGADAVFIRADTSKVDDCFDLIDRAVERFGTVNGLVNAAASGARGRLTDTTPQMWDEMMNTNVRGPFFVMQRFAQHCLATERPGSIVNILSQVVHCGQSYLAPYSASKGALATLTKNVANAHRWQRIRCNAILPVWMDTPGEDATQKKYHGAEDGWLAEAEAKQPFGQLIKTDQLAGLATYMLSPDSGVMTGALVDYDQNVPGAYAEEPT